MEEDGIIKRGRGRGRGTRARGRGRRRGRGRGKKAAVVVSSDEEVSLDQPFDLSTGLSLEDIDNSAVSGVNTIHEDVVMNDPVKNCDTVTRSVNITSVAKFQSSEMSVPKAAELEPKANNGEQPTCNIVPQTIDMEADISQLEAPTFTTISRGPPEPMLRLKWNHKVNLMGEKVLNPMIHICDQCDKPILHYGRMIPCKHVFCLKCARTEPVKCCPRCNDKVVRVEQSGLGTVFMCTHSGSRYGNTGCRRTYLSQRDLQAHINHRHITQPPPLPISLTAIPPPCDIKLDSGMQRKLSDSAVNVAPIQAPSALLLTQRTPLRSSSSIGSIAPPGSATLQPTSSHSSLTQANLARINNANAQECHQGKVALHQSLKKTPLSQSIHQPSESVADASYYSSVLNSFGSSGGGSSGNNAPYESSAGNTSNQGGGQNSWQQQYYR